MAKRKNPRKEQRWLLISDEAAIHYPRRIDYYATLTERDWIFSILAWDIGRRIMLSSFQENDGERSINQKRGIEKRSRRGSRSGSFYDFKRDALHFPRFPWASDQRNYISSLVTLRKNSALNPRILSFYPSHSCLLFPRLIDIPCVVVGRTQWDTVR